MTDLDQRYIDLYVSRRRLMSLNARENRDSINIMTIEIDALKATGDVSDKVIALAPYAPWR